MKKSNLIILAFLIFSVFFFPLSCFSSAPPSTTEINKANDLISNENWDEAIILYNKWILQGQESKEVFYNLSLLYDKKNDLGMVMFNLKKAKKLAPADKVIHAQILLVQEKLKDKFIIPIKSKGYFDKIFKPWDFWTLENTGIVFLISIWILFLQFLAYKIFNLSEELFYFKGIRIFILTVLAISFIQTLRIYGFREQKEVVILSSEAKVHQGADTLSPIIQTVHAGLPVLFENEIGNWNKVRLGNGQIGWILKNHLSTKI